MFKSIMTKPLAIALGLVIAGLLAGSALAADDFDAIKARGTLIVGVKHQVPPFGFLDDETGRLAGFDADLAAGLAKALGVKLQLRPVEQQNRVSSLLDGRVDLIAANLVADPDVGRVISFSEGYLLTGVGFITRKGEAKGLNDLRGKFKLMANEKTEVIAERLLTPAFCLRKGERFDATARILPAAIAA